MHHDVQPTRFKDAIKESWSHFNANYKEFILTGHTCGHFPLIVTFSLELKLFFVF